MRDDDLDAEMQQMVKDLASNPSLRSSTRFHDDTAWLRDDNDQPMTKREAREIIQAIRAIPTYHATETNKLLAEIKAQLAEIKWSVSLLGLMVFVILFNVWH
jgi:uncharacterized protein (DUF2132 family)